jgi:glyoxylase-like metal-dependent hydrolase (beta-lactamase superfamily II)
MLRLYSIPGNSQRLDGGAMFGNAPRAIWSRAAEPDERGRILLSCRAMLVDDGARRILFETGIGAFFAPALRERYGVVESRHVLLESLERTGFCHDQIDWVVLSHLHFDHAGGLLAAHEPGAPRRLLFPRARFVVNRNAFERAQHPHLRDRASFVEELPDLLEQSGRLVLVDGPQGAASLLGERFTFVETNGHTPGMLHTEVQGTVSKVFFCADLAPGLPWVHLPITMGYDRFAEGLVDEKTRLFSKFENESTWLFFTHDPQIAAARVTRDDKGRYVANEQRRQWEGYWDLDLDG